jgi:hypothetical protein
MRLISWLCTSGAALNLLFAASTTVAQSGSPYAAIAPTTLIAAVEILESETGGKVLEIRFDPLPKEREDSFAAVLARGDEILYMREYPVAKVVKVIEVGELPAGMAGWRMTAYVKSLTKAKVPLVEAIAVAQDVAGGPAIGAGLAKPLSAETKVLAHNVEVLKADDRTEVVHIDAETGKRIANTAALYETWTPIKLVRRVAQ